MINQKILWRRLSNLAMFLVGSSDFVAVDRLRNLASDNKLDSDDITAAKEYLSQYGY